MRQIRRIALAPVLISVALCQGCASGQAFTGPIRLASNSDIVVVNATARRKADGILVTGDVRRTDGFAGTIPGYLHVVGRSDLTGSVVTATDTNWGEFINRRLRLGYYKAYLSVDNPMSVTSITVEAITEEPPKPRHQPYSNYLAMTAADPSYRPALSSIYRRGVWRRIGKLAKHGLINLAVLSVNRRYWKRQQGGAEKQPSAGPHRQSRMGCAYRHYNLPHIDGPDQTHPQLAR